MESHFGPVFQQRLVNGARSFGGTSRETLFFRVHQQSVQTVRLPRLRQRVRPVHVCYMYVNVYLVYMYILHNIIFLIVLHKKGRYSLRKRRLHAPVGPVALVSVGVALDEVVGRLVVQHPVSQVATHAAAVHDAVAVHDDISDSQWPFCCYLRAHDLGENFTLLNHNNDL